MDQKEAVLLVSIFGYMSRIKCKSLRNSRYCHEKYSMNHCQLTVTERTYYRLPVQCVAIRSIVLAHGSFYKNKLFSDSCDEDC